MTLSHLYFRRSGNVIPFAVIVAMSAAGVTVEALSQDSQIPFTHVTVDATLVVYPG